MGYIFKQTRWVQQETLNCDHHAVTKIWDTGSLPRTEDLSEPTKIVYNLHLLLGDGRHVQFDDYDPAQAILKAEEFLATL